MRSLVCPLLVLSTFAAAATANDRIELQSGDVLHGEILQRSDDIVIIEHPVFGQLTIPMDQIAAMPPLPETANPLDAADAPELDATQQQSPVPPARAPWRSQIDLGLAGTRGNSDTIDIRAAFVTVQESDHHRWRIDAGYFLGKDDGETTKHSATVGVLRDWLMPDSPWLFFAKGRYDFDDFRDWSHRVSGHGGLGYEFIDNDEFTLIGRAGAGAAKQWKRSEPLRPEGLLGLEFAWNITEQQHLTAHTTLYPDLGDFFQYRVVSGIQWTMQMDVVRGLALSAGIEHEYESRTEHDTEHSDLRFYTGLTIQF